MSPRPFTTVRVLVWLFAVSIALIVGRAAVPRAAGGAPQIPSALDQRAAQDGHVRVIVQLNVATGPHVSEGSLPSAAAIHAQRGAIRSTAARVLSLLPPASHRLIRSFDTVPYIALDVNDAALAALEASGDVVAVTEDTIVRPVLAQTVPLIQGDQAWAAGYDGTGTMIAVLDTGVDSTHPFLAGKVVQEACFSSTVAGLSQSFCPNGQEVQIGPGAGEPCPLSDCIHGTHVAGIAAGNGATANVSFSGVAKGAQLMSVLVFSQIIDPNSCPNGVTPCTGAFSSDIIAAMEYVYTTAPSYNIASVNMSLGGGSFTAPCDDQPYKPAIDNLRSIGIATVVAAGNDAAPNALAAPACVSSAVSVGSTDKTDQVSWFSDIAPFLSLLAPGGSVTSSIPGGGFEALSGTSMAAPHVAGTWGVIKQAAPGASVSQILNALQQTGLPITDTRLWAPGTVTIPRIRIFNALATLASVTSPVPLASAISPTSAIAGTAGLTLAVTGTGFNGLSIVRWNGSDRVTNVLNTQSIQASITAADLQNAGTAQVTVFNPAPGGGTSSPLTFTINPAPVLTVDATLVAPGDAVTVKLVNGLGGSQDWLALAATGAPNTSYIQWIYVGAGVTTRTWTVNMPTTAGTYEFRLFLNNGYTRVATSPSVTVDSSLNPKPVASSLSPAQANIGGAAFTLTVNGSHFISSSVVQWNGASRPTTFVSPTSLQAAIGASDIAAAGTAQVTVVTPAPGGGTSSPLSLPITLPPSLTIVGATTVSPGASVTVQLTGGYGGSQDWLALAATSAANTSYLQWTYVGAGVTTRTWTVNMPTTAGTYEFRLFLNNGYTLAAKSPTVTVTSGGGGGGGSSPMLTTDVSTVVPGGSVTVTLTGGLGGSTDWLSLAAVGAADTSKIQWIYVGAGVTTRTWTVTMPTTPGFYEFRLYLNNGYTRAATSPTVTVQSGPLPTLSVNATSVTPGASVTVTLAGGYGGSQDWLALASTSAVNTSYIQWTYVGAGVTSRSWTVTMPTTTGTYEFRLFLNNGYTRAAVSPKVTVSP